ncbi:MAG: glycosyltransferase [Proteobacteria bacterium]|nr:glycosyltransferase [Pseudomonadota bacterium]
MQQTTRLRTFALPRMPSRLSEPPRIMLYSHDGFGLGHLRRNSLIAEHFVRQVPGATALMVVGSPTGAFFSLPAGVDAIKLPSIAKVATGVWRPASLSLSFETVIALRRSMLLEAARHFRPHLLLADYVPRGVHGELLQTLEYLRSRPTPAKLVLGLRDILDRPEVTSSRWRDDGTYDAIDRYYDRVLFYGRREIFDTGLHYKLQGDGSRPSKARFCGYVCASGSRQSRDQIRRELRLRADKLVLVTVGGGRDGHLILKAYLKALELLGPSLSAESLVVTGPLMSAENKAELRAQSEGLPVRILDTVTDSLGYLQAADLVVTMAGYNTLTEAAHMGKRVVVVPRKGPSAEQQLRTRAFASLGLVRAIPPDQLSPDLLARMLAEGLKANPRPRPVLQADGLGNVVREMKALLALE